jgi:hypothetical protein
MACAGRVGRRAEKGGRRAEKKVGEGVKDRGPRIGELLR